MKSITAWMWPRGCSFPTCGIGHLWEEVNAAKIILEILAILTRRKNFFLLNLKKTKQFFFGLRWNQGALNESISHTVQQAVIQSATCPSRVSDRWWVTILLPLHLGYWRVTWSSKVKPVSCCQWRCWWQKIFVPETEAMLNEVSFQLN